MLVPHKLVFNELTGTIFSYFCMSSITRVLIGRAKRAPHWGVQSRFRVIYIRLITRVSVEYDEIFHDSIVTSRRRVEIQSTSEMSPYFTMTKCNKLFITYLTRSTERLPSLLSSISTNSTISMTVVMSTLFKKR